MSPERIIPKYRPNQAIFPYKLSMVKDLEPVQAFLAQPLGVIGFAMGVAVVLGAAVSVPLGISWLPFLRRIKWPVAAWTALGVGIASWVFEIIRWKLMG